MDDYKEFLQRYSKLLHPNHYHMLTAKHSLMQMMGRTEGYLIQDMSDEMVNHFYDFITQEDLLLEKYGYYFYSLK